MRLLGFNTGTQNSLSAKTRRYADYYRQLANGTLKEVYDDETVTLSTVFYKANVERVTFTKCTEIRESSSTGPFQLCPKLSYVDFPELKIVGINAFAQTKLLTSVFFPKVTNVRSSAFTKSNVEMVNLPVCISLRSYCFNACGKLKEIKIPICSVIKAGAFSDCSVLEKIFLDGVTAVPTLETNVFAGTPETLKIIVPDTLVDSFKTATNWSAYADRIIGVTEYEQTV